MMLRACQYDATLNSQRCQTSNTYVHLEEPARLYNCRSHFVNCCSTITPSRATSAAKAALNAECTSSSDTNGWTDFTPSINSARDIKPEPSRFHFWKVRFTSSTFRWFTPSTLRSTL